MIFETRAMHPAELRENDNGISVEGYAAVFGEVANIGGMFKETIDRAAFDGVLEKSDVVFLINHDGEPLARSTSGTLKLSVDDRGLKIETSLDPSDPDVQRIVPKMRRGDMSKMSFAFLMEGGVSEWDDGQEPPLRTIKRFGSILDVSVVNEPAFKNTEIALRSLEAHRETNKKTKNFSAARLRLRMKKDLAQRENGA